jgi:hypothetical protein
MGNLYGAYLACNRGKCKCTRGELHGPAWRLTWQEEKKRRIAYIRNSEVEEAKGGVEAYQEAKKVLNEIALVNLEIVKAKRKGK